MTEMIATQTAPKSTADYKAAIGQLLQEITRLETQMQLDRVEIERLRAQSHAITRHTDAVLERLGEQIGELGRAA